MRRSAPAAFRALSRASRAVVGGLAVAGLAGWPLTLGGQGPRPPVLIQVGLLLLAASGWRGSSWRGLLAARGALVVGLVAVSETLSAPAGAGHTWLRGVGLDARLQALAPNSALALALCAGARLLMSSARPARRAAGRLMLLALLAMTYLALCGHLFGARTFYAPWGDTPMSLHSAVGLLLAGLGLVVAHPEQGMGAILGQDNGAGRTARRLLPLVLLVSGGVAGLALAGRRHGLYGAELELALVVTATSGVLVAVVLWLARELGAEETSRDVALADRRFLMELSDGLRLAPNDEHLLADAAHRVGRHLDVSRAAFVELMSARALAEAGTVLVSDDVRMDPLTVSHPRFYEALGIRARILVPFVRDGRWLASLLVGSREPRRWTQREIDVAQEAGTRALLELERRRAYASTQRSEARFRSLVEATRAVTFTTDADGAFVEPQPSWTELTGRSWSAQAGLGWHDAIHPDDRTSWRSAWAAARATVGPVSSAVRIQSADGAYRTFLAQAAPLLEPGGDVREWFGLCVDVTTQRAAEEALRLSEERYALAVRGSNDGIWDLDIPSGRAFLSARGLELLGFDADQVGSTRDAWLERTHPEDRARVRAAMAAHLERREPYDLELRVVGADDQIRWFRVRGQALWDEAGRPLRMAGSLSDITPRKLAEDERDQLLGRLGAMNEALEQRVVERTAELSTALTQRSLLLQEVHHRVKNNLQIIASLMSLQMRGLAEGLARGVLEECQARVLTIALVHEKLYRSKRFADVPLSEYAASLASSIIQSADPSLTRVRLDLDVEPLFFPVDRAVPFGLLLNELIMNAVKHAFTETGAGTLRVALRRVDAEQLELEVGDDGVGLPADFDIARSTTLGLQLVQTLTQQLRGHLAVSSREGARFQVTFPTGAT